MKTITQNAKQWIVPAAMTLVAVAAHSEEVYTINPGDVDDFTNKLAICNQAMSGTIVLKPGLYDVSKCSAVYWDTGNVERRPETHLAHDYITVRGETDNPRDVVIFGDGTKPVWYAYQGWIRNLTVSNGCLRSSSSLSGGGGITTYNQLAKMSNVVVTCCTSERVGGGVYLGTYYDSQIVSNATVNGDPGGGACGARNNSLCLYRCLLSDNYSSGSGGAAGRCTLFDCVVSNNTAQKSGGAVYWGGNGYAKGELRCTNTVFVSNVARSAGGAMYDDSEARCVDCTFVGNIAEGGPGGCLYSSGQTVLENCIVSNNVSRGNGGGICGAGDRNCLLYDSDIAFNRCGTESSSGNLYGGGICCGKAFRCRIFGNAAWYPSVSGNGNGAYGGGVFKSDLTDCIVYDNVAYTSGGASRNGTGCNTVFSNNVSLTGSATIYLPSGSYSNCTFYGQTVTGDNKQNFVGCRFVGLVPSTTIETDANAVTNGCFSVGSYLFQGAVALTNCLVADNCVQKIFRNNKTPSPVSIVNCTIVGNRTQATFDEFKMNDAAYKTPAEVVNTILAQNLSWDGTRTVDLSYSMAEDRNVAFTNCLIGPNRSSMAVPLSEVGTITNATPRFVMDGTRDSYALKRSSPARKRGLVQRWMTDATDIRGEGFSRLHGEQALALGSATVDIGCYECWLEPVGLTLSVR